MDLLVKLYDIEESPECTARLAANGISVKRAMAPDRYRILEFIRSSFDEGWAGECEYALSNRPVSCYIAVKEKQVVGFACYDATAKGFFGPTGVKQELRGCGIGAALMKRCFISMKEAGYGYAIIGWAAKNALGFYEKNAGAIPIPDSFPGVYRDLIDQ